MYIFASGWSPNGPYHPRCEAVEEAIKWLQAPTTRRADPLDVQPCVNSRQLRIV